MTTFFLVNITIFCNSCFSFNDELNSVKVKLVHSLFALFMNLSVGLNKLVRLERNNVNAES